MDSDASTVTLPADLVQEVRIRAESAGVTPDDLVSTLLRPVLASTPRLQPMLHVGDMAAAVDFFSALGARIVHGSRDGDWTLLDVGGAELGLLAHPPNPEQGEGAVELNIAASGLDELERRVRSAGVTVVAPVRDEGFGRQLQLRSPDGLLVKVNELRPDLFT